ncbi:alcohol dehydrogenase catalytic domain-containing protein [Gordonia sp. zg691]|uniref:Alcohol dehydrogenase catalytic domain-containing protein n=1 Tax=Gordonia jinghuaiqii TaxID=2758710 RepID=A0A7D7LVL8_9ACTN|nr:alcohol dehydrogenase catalytic domain-containing protein [Gordonia jinghuaiqii]MBD0861048.1 alcohol dehydrogenase catalytic domain-containing protein [Gordonia jinghuaiqii]MCR5979814.1 alcohol dehydrogenase catalytic domain-containing protein [Gordonia jinghuaiqii]QMT00798.1 alcohol dehydrogenase catalytic domain-containing protein [Gordonia jinghuaiqii]
MRAAVTGPGGFEVAEVADPAPGAGEMVLRVSANGVCGSDLSTAPFLPAGTIMGHEFAGEVVAVGPDDGGSRAFGVGDLVASMPVIGCHRCRACLTGDVARCPSVRTLGLGVLPGALAEFVVVGAAESVRLDDVDPVDGALVEPLAVGLHAVTRASIRPGDRALVLGAGPVGLAVLHWLSRGVAAEAVCSDPSPGRRAAALDLGASTVCTPEEVPDHVRGGVDVVIECVGKPGMIAAALDAAATHGRIVVAGVCLSEDTFMPVAGVVKEVSMNFVSYYTKSEFDAAAAELGKGAIGSSTFVSDVVGLDAVDRVFTDLSRPNDHRKVLISPAVG